jgi:hypothetical protein
MPDIITNLLFSAFDLLRSSFVFSLFLFIPVLLVMRLRRFIEKRREGISWVKAVSAALFISSFVTVFAIYSYFNIAALLEGTFEPAVQPPVYDIILFQALYLIRIFIVAVLLALMFLPVSLAGDYINRKVSAKLGLQSGKKENTGKRLLSLFAAVWLTTLIILALLLLFFRTAVAGVIYLIFFAFG